MEAESKKEAKTIKNILPRLIIGTVVVLGAIFLAKEVWFAINHEETDNAQVEMSLVPIISRVTGYVDKTYADDYSTVKKRAVINGCGFRGTILTTPGDEG